MNQADDTRKEHVLEGIGKALHKRLPASRRKLGRIYLAQCFRRVPVAELEREAPATWAAMVAGQLEFLAQRAPGEMLLRVFNPTAEAEGWESPHTLVEIVNDDRPFLVDTAALTLSELDIGIHRIIHPVVRVERDGKGRLEAVLEKSRASGTRESVIQLQIDRTTDPAVLDLVERRLAAAMRDVRAAVDDWKAMERSVADAVERMPDWAPGVKKEWMRECRAFMRWLLDDHFIFLGVRDYRFTGEGAQERLERVPGSGYGILRDDGRGETARPASSLAPAARRRSQKRPLIITKTNARSTVHRSGYLDYIGVLRIDADGKTVGERRFLGLFTSTAYFEDAMQTPMVRVRARNIMRGSGLVEGSHAWKSMVHILQTLPRDELFQANSNQLRDIAEGVLDLQERKLVRLFVRRERYGRFYSCLVYLPREQFNTENRERIQKILLRAFKGERLDYNVSVSESRLARLQVLVRPRSNEEIDYDVAELERQIETAVRSWSDALREIMLDKHGEELGLEYCARFGRAFPEAYKEDVSPWVASFDVVNAAAVDGGEDLRISLYRPRTRRSGIVRFKLFRKHGPLPLSHVLPILENLGLHIVNERPYELRLPDDETLWIQDFDMAPARGGEVDLDAVRALVEDAFRRVLAGESDNDGFNRLVIGSHMDWRQVTMLRAYCKYLQQANIPFSATYMADSVSRHPGMSRILVELFEAKFDPRRDNESKPRRERAQRGLRRLLTAIFADECDADPVLGEYLDDLISARTGSREQQVAAARNAFRRGLQFVTSLDEDRILHAFYEVIEATLRSSFYQCDDTGAPRDYIAFKIDSQALPELPKPRPYREIWVYSARFEGVHLRGGAIARGGLRWSDRKEDFRTEVLGLMKAQNVKNTMIVPVGAKGGFVVKQPPADGGRDAFLAEGVSCYKSFINGLLDITDNLDENEVVPPKDVVRLDGDDPYLVVAADKGTATFSDIANGVAADHGHWLGDAFASGGSVGYDHKGMGITARGAWEAVKRHFREMGKDIQKEPFTVVGIGDMSGDVFGNGMLLSKHTRLQAAFNHLHIFLDPDPDAKASWRERRRLFRKPGSTWLDYDETLISKGGGVFARTAKTLTISPQVRAWLGIEATEMTPNALIRELLRADVDLLWNGGIGTYVKASSETHADVGDLSNNSLRVDAKDLRCKAVGEGGNLGMTQLARVEFARRGGYVNADFIDNSAGVDTSDHEVNIKILLDQAVRAGKLDAEQRKQLLSGMTDEVAQQVLRNTYLQTQAISLMERFSGERLGSMKHFIDVLEDSGALDRELEFLPDDDELEARAKRGEGLYRPELAVLLSYGKITLYQELLQSDVPEDAWLSDEAVNYFPAAIRERYAGYVSTHRLKREIIATQVTNSLVNRMGASFVLRMREDTGASADEIARAYSIAREVFEARDFWARVERLDNRVETRLQLAAMVEMWSLLRHATRWLLNLPGRNLDIGRMVKRLGRGVSELEETVRNSLTPAEREALEQRTQPLIEGGMPRALARRTALLPHLFSALEVVEIAARRRAKVPRVAAVFFGLGERLQLSWLRRQVESLKVGGQWHAMSRANLRDELFAHHNEIVEHVLEAYGRRKDPVGAWAEARATEVDRLSRMLASMKKQAEMDYATLAVAVRALGQLNGATGG
ncbi:MAG: NAD-glutamate dehydrogenase [Xanthomonadales bacterium]